MKGTVIKYYSVTSGPLEWCLKRLKEVEEKHPDREYTILTNMRGGGTKFTLAQYEEVYIVLPTEDDLKLPAPVPKPAGLRFFSSRTPQPDWDAYERDQAKRNQAIKEAQKPAMDLVRRPLNPKR